MNPFSPASEKQPSPPTRRLDQVPKPAEGYPRTPQHEQVEEQLHRDFSRDARDTQTPDEDDEPPTLRNDGHDEPSDARELPQPEPDPVDALADTARYEAIASAELAEMVLHPRRH